jgi:hypothetical protein
VWGVGDVWLTLLAAWERANPLLDLEAALALLIQSGQQRFPQIALSPERFAAFPARCLPSEVVEDPGLSALHGAELFLVRADGLGDRAVHDIMESQYLPAVRSSLRRLRPSEAAIDEVLQELRHMLFAMRDDGQQRRGY